MTQYNHAVYLGFEVISGQEDGEDITPEMLKTALMSRIRDLDLTFQQSEWIEACLPPDNTFEVIP